MITSHDVFRVDNVRIRGDSDTNFSFSGLPIFFGDT
jgi:hypothetical protein